MDRFFVSHPFLSSRILIILPEIRRETKANCFSILYPPLFPHLQIDASDRKSLAESFAQRPVKSLGWLYILNSVPKFVPLAITDQSQDSQKDQILNGTVYVQNTEHFLRSNLSFFTCSFEHVPSNICYTRVKYI